MDNIKSELPADYTGGIPIARKVDDGLISRAQDIIKARFIAGEALTNPLTTGAYLQVLLGANQSEVFGMITLTNRNEVIHWHEMFNGTIDGASVYPREVIKQALADNAAAVIFAHNHPSGTPEPSQADIRITERLKTALAMIDIRVLDHVIVGKTNTFFSERGLI